MYQRALFDESQWHDVPATEVERVFCRSPRDLLRLEQGAKVSSPMGSGVLYRKAVGREGGCTCATRPGDEYYCTIHGGEGCWADLKIKSDMLTEKLGDWIVQQSDEVKESAAEAFGTELKSLGQTLYSITDLGPLLPGPSDVV